MEIETTFSKVIILDEEGIELPKEGTFYVIAKNGVFLRKNNEDNVVSSFSKIRDLQDFNLEEESIEFNLPKINPELAYKVKLFFAKVVEKFGAESYVCLWYHYHLKEYAVSIPLQAVSRSSVHYNRRGESQEEEIYGYIPVGTIHSHCDFQAFHSGTDVNDEENWDGLHVTFGHNDKEEFTISSSILVDKKRVKIDPQKVFDGLENIEADRYKFQTQTQETILAAEQESEKWLENQVNTESWE